MNIVVIFWIHCHIIHIVSHHILSHNKVLNARQSGAYKKLKFIFFNPPSFNNLLDAFQGINFFKVNLTLNMRNYFYTEKSKTDKINK